MALPNATPTNDALAFLSTLYAGIDRGYAVLWTPQRKKSRCFPLAVPGSIPAMAAAALALAPTEDAYMSVCSTAEPLSTSQRGSVRQVAAVPGLWGDIDIKDGAFAAVDEVLDYLRRIPFAPTLLVRSGGGVHAYWLFDRPFVVETEADRERIKATAKRWLALLKREAGDLGAAIDSTLDLARVLRVAGTLNHKESGNPRPVVLFHENPSARHPLAEIERALPVLPSKPNGRPSTAFHLETPAPSADDDAILRRAKLSPNFLALWKNDNGRYGNDRSRGDQAFCDSLVGVGATRDQIDRVFRGSPRMRDKWDEPGHWADRPGLTYGQGTIEKAFDGFVQPRQPRGVVITFPGNRPPTPEAAPQEPPPAPSEPVDFVDWRARWEVSEAEKAALAAKLAETEAERDAYRDLAQQLATERDGLELENAELRQENTTIINSVIHPDLKAETATAIRTAIEYRDAKRRGDVDERGFMKLNTRRIGDDWEDRQDGIDRAIRSRSTVARHTQRMAELGLIDREVRKGIARMPVKRNGQIVRDESGRVQTCEVTTDQTFVRFAGDTLTEILYPFAHYRAPTPAGPEQEPPVKHGGDRRSEAAKARAAAKRTPCPECGSTERKTYCGSCGCDITDVTAADEARMADEIERIARTVEDGRHRHGGTAFQDDPLENRGSRAFQDETASVPTREQMRQAGWDAWARPPTAPPDRHTDLSYGRAS